MVLDPVSQIAVETASGDPRETRTAAELRDLLASHDVSGLQWTRRVIVEARVVAHSHPVLTLNTRSTGDDLLATYLHEQLHWWTADHPAFGRAISDTRLLWPSVPLIDEGGAASEHLTRLHLIVCHLESREMRLVVGEGRASAVLSRRSRGLVYPWVYEQVRCRGDAVDQICTDHRLWPDRLATCR
jgi:hypothetical protein